MTTATLIPASNFQVKKLDGVRFDSPCGQFHVCASGFGLWDVAANGWVSINSFFETEAGPIAAPYSPIGGKKALKFAAQNGLYAGYAIVHGRKG
jgi:hypothetical protein